MLEQLRSLNAHMLSTNPRPRPNVHKFPRIFSLRLKPSPSSLPTRHTLQYLAHSAAKHGCPSQHRTCTPLLATPALGRLGDAGRRRSSRCVCCLAALRVHFGAGRRRRDALALANQGALRGEAGLCVDGVQVDGRRHLAENPTIRPGNQCKREGSRSGTCRSAQTSLVKGRKTRLEWLHHHGTAPWAAHV